MDNFQFYTGRHKEEILNPFYAQYKEILSSSYFPFNLPDIINKNLAPLKDKIRKKVIYERDVYWIKRIKYLTMLKNKHKDIFDFYHEIDLKQCQFMHNHPRPYIRPKINKFNRKEWRKQYYQMNKFKAKEQVNEWRKRKRSNDVLYKERVL